MNFTISTPCFGAYSKTMQEKREQQQASPLNTRMTPEQITQYFQAQDTLIGRKHFEIKDGVSNYYFNLFGYDVLLRRGMFHKLELALRALEQETMQTINTILHKGSLEQVQSLDKALAEAKHFVIPDDVAEVVLNRLFHSSQQTKTETSQQPNQEPDKTVPAVGVLGF